MVQKKPVDNRPLCSERTILKIDPIWVPGRVPPRFWEDRQNRRNYLLWVGWKARFRKAVDWYRLSHQQLRKNRGGSILKCYNDSPALAMVDCFPEYEWYEWFFGHAPRGFWSVPDNRQRYMQWLGRQLGFHRPRDWYGIRQDDFEAHRGSTLLHCYSSMYDFMQEFLPQLDWEPFKYGPPLSIEQILQLADNHFNQYGSWPHSHSGPVNGTNLTWSAISERLRLGFRGTHPGHSLSALLEQYRNVRPGRTPPPLSEKQILAWADAYFALHGRWPTEDSGTITGTQETWSKLTGALREGTRGLCGGSSLAKLLAQHRKIRNRQDLRSLSEREVIKWARAYKSDTGNWPTCKSGEIPNSGGETWSGIEHALFFGRRGFQGGSSVHRFLKSQGLK